jgi:putative membrane protein
VETGGQPLMAVDDDSDVNGRGFVTDRRTEPDARFLLANERTLLAWVRTSLAIIAGGVGIAQLNQVSGRRALAIVLIAFGAFGAAAGTIRYHRADRAIRAGNLPPAGFAPTVVAVSVVAIGVVLIVAVLVR